MLPEGKYRAKVGEHFISETSKGSLQSVVSFYLSGESKEQVTWYGFFSEKTKKSTIEGLIACGLKGNNPAGPLEVGKEVMITIAHETDEKTGQPRARVRWVNPLSAPKNTLAPDLAKAKLAALESAVALARMASPTDDTIPF